MTARSGPCIVVDRGARDWIHRHGGALTLRPSPRHGCCGGTVAVPVAEARTPDRPADWMIEDAAGVRVYLAPELAERDVTLTIRAEGVWRWRRLFVETPDSAVPGAGDVST